MLEKLRKKIIEAVPEIVELKFGCEVKMGTKQVFIVVGMMPNGDPITVKKEGAYDSTKQGADVEKIDGKIEIIGRHIRLADVLYATLSLVVDGKGRKRRTDIVEMWNLKDDNLDHQSPETILFLDNLLKDKNI